MPTEPAARAGAAATRSRHVATGCKNAYTRRAAKHRFSYGRSGADDMLATIKDDQQVHAS